MSSPKPVFKPEIQGAKMPIDPFSLIGGSKLIGGLGGGLPSLSASSRADSKSDGNLNSVFNVGSGSASAGALNTGRVNQPTSLAMIGLLVAGGLLAIKLWRG